MTFSEQIFGKQIHDLKIEDLHSFFQLPREESQNLEFKSGEVQIESIYKEICAFLNTSGGLLIIGAPKETSEIVNGNENKICRGPLVPSKFKNKDWMMHKIISEIVPYPRDIVIKEFQTNEGSFFIIDIPSSPCPPHQCLNDGRYYIRKNDASIPAPHDFIETLYYKRTRPLLTMFYNFQEGKEVYTKCTIHIQNESDINTSKINYSVCFYNIDSVEKQDGDNSYELNPLTNKIEVKEELNIELVKGQSIIKHFNINHKRQPYIIHAICWSKETFIYELFLLYDPENEMIIRKDCGYNLKPGLIYSHIEYLNLLLNQL